MNAKKRKSRRTFLCMRIHTSRGFTAWLSSRRPWLFNPAAVPCLSSRIRTFLSRSHQPKPKRRKRRQRGTFDEFLETCTHPPQSQKDTPMETPTASAGCAPERKPYVVRPIREPRRPSACLAWAARRPPIPDSSTYASIFHRYAYSVPPQRGGSGNDIFHSNADHGDGVGFCHKFPQEQRVPPPGRVSFGFTEHMPPLVPSLVEIPASKTSHRQHPRARRP